ncbi:type 4a pilus biogenesis protein PilO [Patescibacteria group bacterium]|nr:type 4a pilus biogenesis protein PilO [Patescibacteria group bacterium]MBU4511964.1 type 4a pilus biogenesis protein PilO [Patescibacteria group bacterium]MCG2693368.1 type 4a pilus biogenesis protein PilO [Candidatus Parcubacteria bacterium]
MPQETLNSKQTKNISLIVVNYFKFVLIASIILVFALGYFLFLRPRFKQTEQGPSERQQVLETQLSAKIKTLTQLQGFRTMLDSLSDENKRRLNIFLPSEKETPELFVQLNALARENNLYLDSIEIKEVGDAKIGTSPSLPNREDEAAAGPDQAELDPALLGSDASSLKFLDINLSLSGGHYFDLKNFLQDVERNLRLLDVTSVNFIGEGDSFVVNMGAYYIEE